MQSDEQPSSISPEFRIQRRHWVALVLVLSLAASLRLFQVSRDALWHDESFSLEAITGHSYRYMNLPAGVVLSAEQMDLFRRDRATWTIWTSLREDTFPPLYYVLLRFWVNLFGDSDTSLRIPSVLFSVVAVAVLFDVVRLASGTRYALWVALIMAVSGAQIQMSHEVRAYALVLLLSLLACDAMLRIELLGLTRRRVAGLTAAAIGVMLTHYFAYGVIVAIGIYAMIRLRDSARRHTIAVLFVAVVFVAIVWSPFLLRQMHAYSPQRDFANDAGPRYLFNGVSRLAQLPNRTLSSVNERAALSLPAGLLFLFAPVVLAFRRRDGLLWSLMILCVVGSVFSIDLIRHTSQLHYVRYVFSATPALYALLVTVGGRSKLQWVIPPLIVFAAATSLPYVVWPYHSDTEDWRAVASGINGSGSSNDLLVFHGTGHGLPSSRALLLCVSRYLDAPHPTLIIDDDQLSAGAIAVLARRDHFWLISKHESEISIFPGGRALKTYAFPGMCYVWDVEPRAAQASPASGGSIPSAVASSIK